MTTIFLPHQTLKSLLINPTTMELKKATLTFPDSAMAKSFATAWSRHTLRGHTIGAGTTNVTVDIYDLTPEDKAWVDKYIDSINTPLKASSIAASPISSKNKFQLNRDQIRKIIGGKALLNYDDTNPGFIAFRLLSIPSADSAVKKLKAHGYDAQRSFQTSHVLIKTTTI